MDIVGFGQRKTSVHPRLEDIVSNLKKSLGILLKSLGILYIVLHYARNVLRKIIFSY